MINIELETLDRCAMCAETLFHTFLYPSVCNPCSILGFHGSRRRPIPWEEWEANK
jgi:hypothetical protein